MSQIGSESIRKLMQDNGITDIADPKCYQLLDELDPLKHLRDDFELPMATTMYGVDTSLVNEGDTCIYMNGNSLGIPAKRATTITNEILNLWKTWGHHGHLNGDYPFAKVDELAVPKMAKIVGAKEREIALMNGLTVNIHLLFAALYNPTKTRFKILIEEHAFPSDHYSVESQIRIRNLDIDRTLLMIKPRPGEDLINIDDLIQLIDKEGENIAIVWLPGIQYYTGQLFDMKMITERAQKKGCLVGWDLAHAVGNVELYLHDWNVDFAVWCTYKYLNASAGGVAGAYMHERFLPAEGENGDRQMLQGWWGHRASTRFAMTNVMELADGLSGFRLSNPPAVLFGPLFASLEIFDKTSMRELRTKSVLLTSYMEKLIDHYFSKQSTFRKTKAICNTLTSKDENQRGAQLSLTFDNIKLDSVYNQLEQCGVSCDVRQPCVIRVAPTPLYTRFKDVYRFVHALLNAINTCE